MLTSNAVEEFYQQFSHRKNPFKCINHQAHCAHIHFSGKFNQQSIIWDAEIKTLNGIAKTSASNKTQYLRQFIDIQATNDKLIPITIALNVENITTPVIIKTMIMINHYKLLNLGKHEYGEIILFD